MRFLARLIPFRQNVMFDDQRMSLSEWDPQFVHVSGFRASLEPRFFARMKSHRFARMSIGIVLVCSCFVIVMGKSVAQETSETNGGANKVEKIDGDRSEFSWPRNSQPGSLVVFLGDSITHQGLYTQYLENFFYTRYPELGIRFRNAGVAGDSISDALARFDVDVASHSPDYVTVLFGMNDGRYEDYDAAIFAEFQSNLKQLLDRIESVGATPIVLSPTMFDHEVTRLRKNDLEWRFRDKEISGSYNALMSLFGAWSWDESRRRGNAFVNLWAPLNSYTDLGRRVDPKFTLIGDAIHPQPSGQVVMAYEILMQLGVERRFSASRVISTRGSKWIAGKRIKDLHVADQGRSINFKHDEVALPWVIPEQHSTRELRWNLPSDAKKGFKMTHAGHRLSGDRLKIAGLPPGQYEVRVDGNLIGNWSHVVLGTKVELQELPKTPQYQQSLAIAELNRRRYDEFVRPTRDRMASLKGLKRRFAVDSDEYARRSEPILATIQELQSGADRLDREIRELSQPACRQWDIRRVDSPSQSK